jgi:nitrogen regulatory protein PII
MGAGMGGRRGTASFTAGAYMLEFIPKIELELVRFDDFVDTAVDTTMKARATGKIGDRTFLLSAGRSDAHL